MNNNIQASSILHEDIYSSQRTEIDVNQLSDVKGTPQLPSDELDARNIEQAKDAKENESPTDQQVDEEEFKAAFEAVSSFIESVTKNVSFNNDSESGKTIIKVIDKETSEIISQFPSDKIVSIAERIKGLEQEISNTSGILFDDSV